MIIKYTNFSDGVHHFNLTDKVENLGLENLFFGDVAVDCKMDKSPHQIVLNCNITAKSKLVCDRCASEFDAEMKSSFMLSFIFTKESEKSEDLNFRFLPPDQDRIDISEDVYEYAELAVPMKKLCSEECKGLCPKCGTNLNENKCDCKTEIENDIWTPLKNLKDQFKN